ncbi:MAG: nucleotide pyrophosphatase [Thermoprotei archaeon]|nr:MAG: nucleotide pyrophosphatase [Thermoprotei archaeon]
MGRKLIVIGLDAAPPSLVYDELKEDLPNLSELTEGGAKLLSTNPPITIPAWAVMVTGKSPGELGFYGFRHRKKRSYNSFYIVNSRFLREPTIWDLASRKGLKNIVVGVPPSYPPRPLNGLMISCFITPSSSSQYTYPSNLKEELEKMFNKYIFDVVYRSENRDKVKEDLWVMTKNHFRVLKHLIHKPWDFFMFVEIGVDRVQHAFWGFMDKEHHKYIPGNKYESVIKDYYKLIDELLGFLIKDVPRDAVIMAVSDHGAKRMKGAFVINQWMIDKGYLKLRKDKVPKGAELDQADVDWSKSIAWGWGGYYARVFLNVRGRDPKGVVDPKDYEHYRDELKEELTKVKGPNGEKWENKVFKPEELYPVVRGDAPDLIAYFDDLSWRSAGTLGWGTLYLKENDRGPDDAVHDWYGILSLYDPENSFKLTRDMYKIEEVSFLMKEILGISN